MKKIMILLLGIGASPLYGSDGAAAAGARAIVSVDAYSVYFYSPTGFYADVKQFVQGIQRVYGFASEIDCSLPRGLMARQLELCSHEGAIEDGFVYEDLQLLGQVLALTEDPGAFDASQDFFDQICQAYDTALRGTSRGLVRELEDVQSILTMEGGYSESPDLMDYINYINKLTVATGSTNWFTVVEEDRVLSAFLSRKWSSPLGRRYFGTVRKILLRKQYQFMLERVKSDLHQLIGGRDSSFNCARSHIADDKNNFTEMLLSKVGTMVALTPRGEKMPEFRALFEKTLRGPEGDIDLCCFWPETPIPSDLPKTGWVISCRDRLKKMMQRYHSNPHSVDENYIASYLRAYTGYCAKPLREEFIKKLRIHSCSGGRAELFNEQVSTFTVGEEHQVKSVRVPEKPTSPLGLSECFSGTIGAAGALGSVQEVNGIRKGKSKNKKKKK
ncbi:MAG: hypothetical protein QG604_858 [Candidatus Dependentiae bacterium]|nr:hypothetical protein [Candidatus Dependentiae bacterium]